MEGSSLRDEGVRLLQGGDSEAAQERFAQAIALNPEDGASHLYLGICQGQRGDLEASVRSLQTAAALRPTDPTVRYNLGLAFQGSGRLDDARSSLETALALKPDYARASEMLSKLGGASETVPGQLAQGPTPPSEQEASRFMRTQIDAPPPLNPLESASHSGSRSGTIPTPFGRVQEDGSLSGEPGAPPGPGTVPPTLPFTPPPFNPPPFGGPGGAPETMSGVSFPQGASTIVQRSGNGLLRSAPPGKAKKVTRGLLYGAYYGQYWTLWTLFWLFMWNAGGVSGSGLAIFAAVYAVMFAFFGSVSGAVAGAIDADEGTAQAITIGAGVICCLIEVLVFHSATLIINLIFYFYTGRYIGRSVARKINQPVLTEPSPKLADA